MGEIHRLAIFVALDIDLSVVVDFDANFDAFSRFFCLSSLSSSRSSARTTFSAQTMLKKATKTR